MSRGSFSNFLRFSKNRMLSIAESIEQAPFEIEEKSKAKIEKSMSRLHIRLNSNFGQMRKLSIKFHKNECICSAECYLVGKSFVEIS
jgi:hypothetical protein